MPLILFLLFLLFGDTSGFGFPERCSIQLIDYQLDAVGNCVEDDEACRITQPTTQTLVTSTTPDDGGMQECWYTRNDTSCEPSTTTMESGETTTATPLVNQTATTEELTSKVTNGTTEGMTTETTPKEDKTETTSMKPSSTTTDQETETSTDKQTTYPARTTDQQTTEDTTSTKKETTSWTSTMYPTKSTDQQTTEGTPSTKRETPYLTSTESPTNTTNQQTTTTEIDLTNSTTELTRESTFTPKTPTTTEWVEIENSTTSSQEATTDSENTTVPQMTTPSTEQAIVNTTTDAIQDLLNATSTEQPQPVTGMSTSSKERELITIQQTVYETTTPRKTTTSSSTTSKETTSSEASTLGIVEEVHLVTPTPTSTRAMIITKERSTTTTTNSSTPSESTTETSTSRETTRATERITTTTERTEISSTIPVTNTTTTSLETTTTTTTTEKTTSPGVSTSGGTSETTGSLGTETSGNTTRVLEDHTAATISNENCSIECPDGYIVGSNYCFLMVPATEVASYQAALSYCRLVDRQDMISYEHLRERSDLQILTQSSISNEMSWFFANGGGSKTERFQKTAHVFNIYEMTLASSPIAEIVELSEETFNVSAICVLPQYCNPPRCLVETSLEVLNVDHKMNATASTIESQSSTTIRCGYTAVETRVTCGTRGTIIPHPSMISCEAESEEQVMDDDTGELVASCAECFARGTEYCYIQTIGNQTGFGCSCKPEYSMKTCWYTSDTCNSIPCVNGTCAVRGFTTYCECDWGYEGERCDISKNPADRHSDSGFLSRLMKSIDSSTVSAIQLTTWTILSMATRVVGKVMLANDEDDPQETHQSLRGVFLTMGTTGVLLFNNPYLFLLPTTTCRMYFLIIHFLFVCALTQWLLEGFNANQVLRCRHSNRWEVDFTGKRAFGIMAIPRLVPSVILVAAVLITIYQSGWYQLVATWTCTGVICKTTSSMWLPIGFTIICVLLVATAVFENSVRVVFRRPLFDLIIRRRIDMNDGIINGQNVEKCRRNPLLCFIGILLLAASWWLVILTSDKRSNKLLGVFAIGMATAYGIFSFIQGIITCPSTYASVLRFLMSRFPRRISPSYEPMGMWTREEIRGLSKEQRVEYIPKNAKRFLQYKWDYQLNSRIAQGIAMEPAIEQILRDQMDQVERNQGSELQRRQILLAFGEWLRIASDQAEPMANTEQVSICGRDSEGVVRTAMFYIVPHFGAFEPQVLEVPEGEAEEDCRITKSNYQVIREEAESQANFISSAIHFKHFGKITE